MTVPSTTQTAGPFNGNGVTTSFPFTFKCFDRTHLRWVTATSGVETEGVLDSTFSVTLNGDQDANPGGTVTYPVSGSAMPVGTTATLVGNVPLGQSTDLPDGGRYFAATVEQALDVLALQNVQQQDQINLSLRLPVTAPAGASGELPYPSADKILSWDAAGTALVNRDVTEIVTTAAYSNWQTQRFSGTGSQTLFVLSSDPGSVHNMDVSISGVTQVNNVDFTSSGILLTFTTAPPAGTNNIMVRYGQALPQSTTDAGSTAFSRSASYSAGSVGSALQTLFNVKDSPYSAKGDGTTDDTSAIQAAITAAKVGGVVYFPPGTYKITASLTLFAGVTLQGASGVATAFGVHTFTKNPSKIWQATAATPCVTVGGSASQDTLCDWNIRDLSFTATQTPVYNDAPVTGKHGIYCHGTVPYSAYRASVERCTFFDFDSGIFVDGYDTGSGIDWQLDNVLIQRNTFFQCNNGIYLNTINADAWLISTNIFVIPPNGKGVYCQRSGYCVAMSNYAVPGYATGGTVATGTEMFRMGAYPDNFKMIGNAGSDGLAYFLRVDSSTGYENNELIYDLDSNIIEAPCLIERRCKILSRGNRILYDVTCSGNDIEVHSYGDSWNPTTKKFLMTGLRPRLFVDPGNTQTSGTVSTTTAAAATAVTIPASAGAYEVFAWLTAAGSIYQAHATLMCDGTTLARISGTNGANMTITVSGRNVQVTQISGAPQTVNWSYNRIA